MNTIKHPFDNGLPCTCHEKGYDSGCLASLHKRKPQDPETWLDCKGVKIVHGDKLAYHNPNLPEKPQPIHTAVVAKGDCWIKPRSLPPSRARTKGGWQPKRWTIISSPANK